MKTLKKILKVLFWVVVALFAAGAYQTASEVAQVGMMLGGLLLGGYFALSKKIDAGNSRHDAALEEIAVAVHAQRDKGLTPDEQDGLAELIADHRAQKRARGAVPP